MLDHSSHLKEDLIASIEQKVETQNQLSSSLENTDNEKSTHAQTVLIAEDVESHYLLLKNILKKEYRILRAHDGLEAIEIFQKECPDLI